MDRITLEMKTVEEAVESALKMLNAKREDVDVIVEDEPSKGFLGIGAKDAKVTVVLKNSGLKDQVLQEIEDNKSDFELKVDEIKSGAKDFIADAKETFNDIKEDAEEKFQSAKETVQDKMKDAKEDIEEEYHEVKDDVEEFVDDTFNKKSNLFLLEGVEHYNSEDEMAEAARQYLEKLIKFAGFEGHVEIIDEREQEENIVLDIVLDNYEQNSRVIGKKGDTINSLGYMVAQFVRGRYDGKMIIEVDCGDYIYDQKEKLKAFARSAAERALRDGEYKLRPMNAYDRRIVHKALNDMEGVSTHSEGEEPRRSIVITRDPQ